jgi:hypothetical protein
MPLRLSVYAIRHARHAGLPLAQAELRSAVWESSRQRLNPDLLGLESRALVFDESTTTIQP